jgi:hypothetical protein
MQVIITTNLMSECEILRLILTTFFYDFFNRHAYIIFPFISIELVYICIINYSEIQVYIA